MKKKRKIYDALITRFTEFKIPNSLVDGTQVEWKIIIGQWENLWQFRTLRYVFVSLVSLCVFKATYAEIGDATETLNGSLILFCSSNPAHAELKSFLYEEIVAWNWNFYA